MKYSDFIINSIRCVESLSEHHLVINGSTILMSSKNKSTRLFEIYFVIDDVAHTINEKSIILAYKENGNLHSQFIEESSDLFNVSLMKSIPVNYEDLKSIQTFAVHEQLESTYHFILQDKILEYIRKKR